MKKRTTILTTLTLTGLLLTGCAASASQISRIDIESAKTAAINAAEVSADEVEFLSVELEKKLDLEYYDIEFYANGNEYDFEIDALTGRVLSYDYDVEYNALPKSDSTVSKESKIKAPKESTASAPVLTVPEKEESAKEVSSTEITEAEAKKIALEQVPGASENDIHEFEVDYDDGRLEYEGSIYYGELEYEFEIDGYSGAIRSWEVESIYD